MTEIERQVPAGHRYGGWLTFVAVSSALFSRAGVVLGWTFCRWPALLALPLAAGLGYAAQLAGGHPGAAGALWAWPLVVLLLYRILYEQETLPQPVLQVCHAGTLWLLAAVLTLEGGWQVDRFVAGAGIWRFLCYGVVLALLLFSVVLWPPGWPWPVTRHRRDYLGIGATPVAVIAWLWSLWATWSCSGDPWPLLYLPVLNPLDIALAFLAVALYGWGRAMTECDDLRPFWSSPAFFALWGGSLFVWGNGLLARAVHHLTGVPFSRPALFHSFLLQTTMTIVWCLCALALMVLATRGGRRPLWLTGAALLALVIVKLFFVDLAGTGTIERIVSFVGVGLLTLVIGWFAPVPPRREGRPS